MQRRYEISFGQVMLSKPTFRETDGASHAIFPQDCRIRNLTYAAPLYAQVIKRTLIGVEDPESMTGEMQWREDGPPEAIRATIGRVRIYLSRSRRNLCLH